MKLHFARSGAFVVGVAVFASASVCAAPPKKKSTVKPAAIATKPAVPIKTSAAAAVKPQHPAPHWAVAFSPDASVLFVGTYQKVLRFDTKTGAKTADWKVSGDAIRALALSPDGTRLAVGTGLPAQSGSVIILDVQTGQIVKSMKAHADLVESVAWKSPGEVLSASDDEKVGLSDTATGQKEGSLTEHTGRALSVAVPVLPPNAKPDASAGGGDIFFTGGADKAVKVWDGQARRVVVNFDQSPGAVWALAAYPRPTGRVAAACDDGKVRVFVVRMDGAKPASGNEPQARTGYLERTTNAHEGAVYCVAALGDGSMLTGGADNKVILWAANGNKKKEWTEAQSDVWGVALSPDGALAAAASEDGMTRLYDTKTGNLLFTLGASGAVPILAPAQPDTQKTVAK